MLLLTLPAFAQTTSISTQYVGTLYAPLDAPQIIDSALQIYNVQPGGWMKGPDIDAIVIAPSADWLKILPSGALRLDVRVTLKTVDDQLIYLSYGGVILHSAESFERLMNGEVLTSLDHYFVTAPTMRTASEKYAWVNYLQFIGKVVEVKVGEGSFVKYDIYAVR
jgi:hypothetical protein